MIVRIASLCALCAVPAGAAESVWAPEVALGQWEHLVVHHTGTEAASLASIDRVHQSRRDGNGLPWRGIGYHFVIGNGRGMADGEVAATFRWVGQLEGAHAGHAEFNQRGIGICLIGNFEDEPPTPSQLKSLRTLSTELASLCRLKSDKLVPHRSFRATACPGRQFPAELLIAELPAEGPRNAALPVSVVRNAGGNGLTKKSVLKNSVPVHRAQTSSARVSRARTNRTESR